MSGMVIRRAVWKAEELQVKLRATYGIHQLPLELIEIIFEFCGCIGNGNTLLNPCSLVNHYWLALSRRQFFRRRLTITDSTIPRFIAAMENPVAPTTIPFYDIRTLTLKVVWWWDFLAKLDHIRLFRRLLKKLDGPVHPDTLVLHFAFPMWWDSRNEVLSGLKNTFPRIKHLDLDYEDLDLLLRFICSFPELQTLKVVCRRLYAQGMQLHTYRLPESVHTLHLCIIVFLCDAHFLFLQWLSEQPRTKESQSLSLMDPEKLHLRSNGMMLHCLQQCKKLKSLYLIFPADGIIPTDDEKGYMVGHLHELQCISFRVSRHDAISRVLNRVRHTLEIIPCIKLNTVAFVMNKAVISDAWDGLDVILSSRKFDGVRKRIAVVTTQELAANTYRKLLPRCEKQGSLSVTRLCKEGSSDMNMLETRLI